MCRNYIVFNHRISVIFITLLLNINHLRYALRGKLFELERIEWHPAETTVKTPRVIAGESLVVMVHGISKVNTAQADFSAAQ